MERFRRNGSRILESNTMRLFKLPSRLLFKIFVEALALVAMLASVWALVFVLQFAYSGA